MLYDPSPRVLDSDCCCCCCCITLTTFLSPCQPLLSPHPHTAQHCLTIHCCSGSRASHSSHQPHYIRIVSSDCRLLTCQQRCLMMLGKESVTALYVGGWCWCRSAGDQFLQWRVGRRHQAVTRHCATTAVSCCSHVTLTHDIIYWSWLLMSTLHCWSGHWNSKMMTK